MSRIARKPIYFDKKVYIVIKKKYIYCIKDKLSLKLKIPNFININLNLYNYVITLIPKNNSKNFKKWSLIGTFRSLLNNNIIGVSKGFKKKLILVGIGYKAEVINNYLLLNIGYTHIIKYKIPNNIFIKCSNINEIDILGCNKQLVGQVASHIRSYRPPEKYRKGKGIRYFNELVLIKEYKKKK